MPVISDDNKQVDLSSLGFTEVEDSSHDDLSKFGFTEVKKKVSGNGSKNGTNGLSRPSDGIDVKAEAAKFEKERSQERYANNFGLASPKDLALGQMQQPDNTANKSVEQSILSTEEKMHHEENAKKRKDYAEKVEKATPKAIENAAKKSLKIKGLNPNNSALLNEEKSKLYLEYVQGNATVGFDKNDEPGLINNPSFWSTFHDHMMSAIQENKNAREFAKMSVPERVEFVRKQQDVKPSHYIAEHPNYYGEIGGAVPTLGLYAAGAATGAVLESAAPETGGLSHLALKPVMTFVMNAGGGANAKGMQGTLNRFYELKHKYPDMSDEEAMKKAGSTEEIDRLAGIAETALFSKVGSQLKVGKSVTGNLLKGIHKAGLGMAKTTAGVEGLRGIGHQIAGDGKSAEGIIEDMATTFKDSYVMGAELHGLMGGISQVIKLPALLKSSLKYDVVTKMPPEQVKEVVDANVRDGNVTQESGEKTLNELAEFDQTLRKVPNGLSDEAKASVTGLIIKRDNIVKSAESKDKSAQDLIKQQTDAIDNQIKEIYRTGKPLEHEVNEATGATYKQPTFDDVQKQRVEDLADKIAKGKRIEDAEDIQAEANFPEELKKKLEQLAKEEAPKEDEKQSDAFKNINKYLKKNESEKPIVEPSVSIENKNVEYKHENAANEIQRLRVEFAKKKNELEQQHNDALAKVGAGNFKDGQFEEMYSVYNKKQAELNKLYDSKIDALADNVGGDTYLMKGDKNAKEGYHFTSEDVLDEILNTDEINGYQKSDEGYGGVSLTTDKNLDDKGIVLQYGNEHNKNKTTSDQPIRIDFNIEKLKNDGYKTKLGNEDLGTFPNEQEVRIVRDNGNGINNVSETTIENAKDYINNVQINEKLLGAEKTKALIKKLEENNIPYTLKAEEKATVGNEVVVEKGKENKKVENKEAENAAPPNLPPVEDVATGNEVDKPTGVKKSVTEDTRIQLSLPKVEFSKVDEDTVSLHAAKERVDDGQSNPRELVNRILSDEGGYRNEDEVWDMQYYTHQLQSKDNSLRAQLAEAANDVDKAKVLGQLQQLSDETDRQTEAAQTAGNKWHKVGMAMQPVIDTGFNPSRERQYIKDAYNGETPGAVKAKLDALIKERDNALNEKKRVEELLKEQMSKKGMDRIKKEAQKSAKRDETKEKLKTEEQELLKEIRKSIKKDLGSFNAGIPVPTETLNTLGKLAVNYFKQGVVTLEGLVDKMYENLKDDIDVSRKDIRDFLAEYEPLSESREVHRLTKKAEGLENKITPPTVKTKSGELRGVSEPTDFAKPTKIIKQFKKSSAWVKANQRVGNAEYKIRSLKRQAFESQKNWYQKGLMWMGRLTRLSVLSGYNVLYKLAAAATIGGAGKRIPEQLIGKMWATVFKGIAEKAPIEGSFNAKSEAKFYTEFFNPKKFVKNSWEILKTGSSDLSKRLGSAEYEHVAGLYLPTDLHQIIKDPLKRGVFESSFRNAMIYAEKNGLDINDPLVIQSLEVAAYKRANYEIFQEQNWLSKKLSSYKSTLEKEGNTGATVKFLIDFMIPVSTVPTNIVRRVITTSPLGLIRGSKQVIEAYRKGLSSLTDVQADKIMMQLKQGSLGTGLWLMGWYAAAGLGGLYSKYNPDKQRKEGELAHDEMEVGDVMLPKPVQHALPLEIMQFAATARHVYDNYTRKGASTPEAVYNAAMGAIGELLEQVPIVETVTHTVGAFGNPYEAKKLEEDVKRRFQPQILRETGVIEKEEKSGGASGRVHKPAKRKPAKPQHAH